MNLRSQKRHIEMLRRGPGLCRCADYVQIPTVITANFLTLSGLMSAYQWGRGGTCYRVAEGIT